LERAVAIAIRLIALISKYLNRRTLAPLSASPHEVGQRDAESHYGRADAPATAVVPLVAAPPRPATRPLRAIGPSTIEPDVSNAIRKFFERLDRTPKRTFRPSASCSCCKGNQKKCVMTESIPPI
jgi:hypothetical protein